jgi:hypothetical protein
MGGHCNRPRRQPGQPRPARGRRGGQAIPLVLAAVFVAMEFLGIDLQRISLGALIIALGLLVDDAMITVETMVTRLEQGDDKERAATFAYASTAFPMLAGTLVTIAGFVPIGFARSAAGEYTFSIFAVVAIALIASWCVAVVFAPCSAVGSSRSRGPRTRRSLRRLSASSASSSRWRCAAAGSRSALRLPCSARRSMECASFRGNSFQRLTVPSSWSTARECVHLCNKGRFRPTGQAPEGRPGRRPLEHVCGAGRRPFLSA